MERARPQPTVRRAVAGGAAFTAAAAGTALVLGGAGILAAPPCLAAAAVLDVLGWKAIAAPGERTALAAPAAFGASAGTVVGLVAALLG